MKQVGRLKVSSRKDTRRISISSLRDIQPDIFSQSHFLDLVLLSSPCSVLHSLFCPSFVLFFICSSFFWFSVFGFFSSVFCLLSFCFVFFALSVFAFSAFGFFCLVLSFLSCLVHLSFILSSLCSNYFFLWSPLGCFAAAGITYCMCCARDLRLSCAHRRYSTKKNVLCQPLDPLYFQA